MLLVRDGLRTSNHANAVVSFPNQTVSAQANSTPTCDMANFVELLAVGVCSTVTGSGTGQLQVQESNESGANFTNVTNAIITFNTANTIKVLSIDWRKPGRKRYARLTGTNTTNSVALMGEIIRVGPKNVVTQGNNVVITDS